MLALKGAIILSVTPPSGRLGMKTCACGSAGARALSLSRRACVRARPCPPPSGGSSRRRRRRWKRTKGLKCFLFNAASFIGGTNERTSDLPCCQVASSLPACQRQPPTSQTAGGGEEGAGTRPRLALGTLTIPLQHLRTIEREKRGGRCIGKGLCKRASQRNAHEREGFRNSERRADRATNYMKETW